MHANEFLQFADSLPEALILLSADGQIIVANKIAAQFLQADKGSLPGRCITDFTDLAPAKFSQTLRSWRRSRTAIPIALNWKEKTRRGWCCQGFLLQPATDTKSAQLVLRCIPGRTPAKEFMALNHELAKQQATLRKLQSSREALKKEHELAMVTLHSICDAVITTSNTGEVEYLNPVAESLTGWNTATAKGKHIDTVFKIVNEVTRQPMVSPVTRCLTEGQTISLVNHTTLIAKDGMEYVIEDSAAPIRGSCGMLYGVVLVFRDVTSDKLARRQLEYLAQHDILTGLNNRRNFEQQLEQVVQLAARNKSTYALFYIDLDQFKVINDTAGHAAGDGLLTEVAHLFASRLRKGDILARLGGDEFGVLLENVPATVLDTVARSYIQALDGFHFNWDGKQYDITPSLGISIIDQQTISAAEVMREADIACYIAKRDGRNRYHLYTPDDESGLDALGEMAMVNEIRRALVNDNFVLYQQQIVSMATNTTTMSEILLRLQTDDGDLITPASFIPVAERYGLMPMIDQWVLRKSLSQLQKNISRGKDCNYSINLSGASFGDSEILALLKSTLAQQPGLAQHILLEVTETSAVRHIEKAIDFMRELCALGIRFALDDFGTGFSSFAYLKHLPIEIIKIDGTFVRDIVSDPVDQAMVRSINHIAHSLGKTTIAEFVENEEVLDYLHEIGVDMIQGYHVGRPVPLV